MKKFKQAIQKVSLKSQKSGFHSINLQATNYQQTSP